MQLLLTQHRDPNLRSYFVWGPFIRSDNEAAARENAQRFAAPNSMHFWTPTPKLGEDLSATLRLPAGRTAWDVFLLYTKRTFWDSSPPAPAYWQQQLEVVQGDPYDVTVFDAHIVKALGSPSRP